MFTSQENVIVTHFKRIYQEKTSTLQSCTSEYSSLIEEKTKLDTIHTPQIFIPKNEFCDTNEFQESVVFLKNI